MELYPGLAKPVYLKSYRYNLHVRKKSLLIELGNENNTLQEAKNAMEPLAKVLDQVLSGK
jgi:stage II sporulation protein P